MKYIITLIASMFLFSNIAYAENMYSEADEVNAHVRHYFENVDPQTRVAIDVKALTLFSSYLRRNGAVYSPVSRYPLRGN